MPLTPSLKVEKTFTYRGTMRRFSNRYHFNGGTPADAAHWTTLADAVVTAEKAIYSTGSAIQIVTVNGYAAGSDVPVFTKAYTTNGTGSFVATAFSPGDVAVLVRYSTTARTTKNHPIYLYNYYHGATQNGSGDVDTVNVTQRTSMGTYANAWIAGFSDGTTPKVRAGPNGATATSALVEPYLTHRDLPR